MNATMRLMALLAIFAAGCVQAPVSAPTREAAYQDALQRIDIKKCLDEGGALRNVCRLQRPACVRPFEDAGTSCTDNSQCKGKCVLELDHEPTPDEAVTGRCQIDDNPCGCIKEVVGGRAAGGRCVD